MGADKDAGKGRGSRLSQSRAEPPRRGVAGPPVLSHCRQQVNPGATGDENGDKPGSRPTSQDGTRNFLALPEEQLLLFHGADPGHVPTPYSDSFSFFCLTRVAFPKPRCLAPIPSLVTHTLELSLSPDFILFS